MAAKKVDKRVLKSMLDFFEKYDMVPMAGKKDLEAAYQAANNSHYNSGVFDYSDYTWQIEALKELIARKEKETSRVKKTVRTSGVNRRYF
jgi:hypothetical protein